MIKLPDEVQEIIAENERLKLFITKYCFVEDDSSDYGFSNAATSMPPTPTTEAYLESKKAEVIETQANFGSQTVTLKGGKLKDDGKLYYSAEQVKKMFNDIGIEVIE